MLEQFESAAIKLAQLTIKGGHTDERVRLASLLVANLDYEVKVPMAPEWIERLQVDSTDAVKVKPLVPCKHLQQCMAIERAAYVNPGTASHWTEQYWTEHLAATARYGLAAICADTREVLGYAAYEIQTEAILLLRMAVHPQYQRQRIATRMLVKLINKLKGKRATLVTYVVDGELETVGYALAKHNLLKPTAVSYLGENDSNQHKALWRFEHRLDGNYPQAIETLQLHEL